MRFENLCNKTNHRIINPGWWNTPKRSSCVVAVKNDPKILWLSFHQVVGLIFPPTESGLCDYLRDTIMWKWRLGSLSLRTFALGIHPPCPYEEAPKALAHWAPSWHVMSHWEHDCLVPQLSHQLWYCVEQILAVLLSITQITDLWAKLLLLLFSAISFGACHTINGWNVWFAPPLMFISPLHCHLANLCLTI